MNFGAVHHPSVHVLSSSKEKSRLTFLSLSPLFSFMEHKNILAGHLWRCGGRVLKKAVVYYA